MNDKNIIDFSQGILYLKLKEEFNTATMQIHCTIAKISKTGVRVVKANSQGEVSSTSMRLSAEEMDLLEEGRQTVKHWWSSGPLEKRHVLLECGHICDWDEWNERENHFADIDVSTYQMPDDLRIAYCSECDEMSGVHRFNEADFVRGQ